MKGWLRLLAGPYQMLLAIDGVREIRETLPGGEGGERRLWRGRVLRHLSWRALLCAPPAASSAPGVEIVYGADGDAPPVILSCDRVVRLEYLEEHDFQPLPPFPPPLSLLFDKARLDPESRRFAFRCRHPLPSLAPCDGAEA